MHARAAGPGGPGLQGSTESDKDRTAFLARWLDDAQSRNLLALAIDAAFLLQGINAIQGIIASELAHQPPDAVAPFIDSARGKLQLMEGALNVAVAARKAGEPVHTELLVGFVQHAKELAASVNALLAEGSEKTEVSEDLLVRLADFSSRATAGAAGLAVVQNLMEQRASPEAREMCVDYLDALVEVCLGAVQSLLVGLENVRALFRVETTPPPPTSFNVDAKGRTWWESETLSKDSVLTSRKREQLPEPPAQGGTSLLAKPVELQYEVQKVFFATDRVPTKGASEGVLSFSNQMHDTLETGWTDVSIPRKWEDGTRRKPGEMDKDQDDASDPRYHIILLPAQNGIYPRDRVQFHQDLRKETEARGGGLLLFIHGYNMSFKSTIRSAAQLAFDLKTDDGTYGGAVLAYDWASYGETLRYGFLPGEGNDDRDRARASAGRLANLLRELALNFPEKKLHIVAHSMGNFCLKNALDLLNADAAQLAQFRALTRTATFAAPDVSRDDFRAMVNHILPQKNPVNDPGAPLVVTLFCAQGDVALLVSSILRFVGLDFGYRAGLYRAWMVWRRGHRVHPVLLPGQVDTVDASGFATDSFGHGYFSNNGSLLTEISKIINLGKRAQDRLLERPVSLALHDADCETCASWYRVVNAD